MQNFTTYEVAINDDYFILALHKSNATEFMVCRFDSNIRYWVSTLAMPEHTHPEEIISAEIKENSTDWINIWNSRCNGEICMYDN